MATASVMTKNAASVLVLSANSEVRARLRSALTAQRWEVYEADGGAAALLLMEQTRPQATLLDGPLHGADGTCARRSAAILVRAIIWLALGLIMDRMLAVRLLAQSLSGVTMSARLSAGRTASGVTSRIRLLLVSAMKRLPAAFTAMPSLYSSAARLFVRRFSAALTVP